MSSTPAPHRASVPCFLVTRRQTLQEDEKLLETLLSEKEKPKMAWLTAPTGKPHVCYFVPLAKMVDFLRAGLEVTVCLVDVYAFLVNYKHPMELSLGVQPGRVKFVRESDMAYGKEFAVDVQKLCASMAQQDARATCEETASTTMLGPMLCSIYPSLAEEYLSMDVHFGGEDQAGFFAHARRFLPLLGYKQRLHVTNPMVAGLDGLKMSSSKPPATKIEFLDDPDTVRRKVRHASCPPREIAGNGVMELLRHVLLPISELRRERERGQTGLNADEGLGGDGAPADAVLSVSSVDGKALHFSSYEELERGYVGGGVDPQALKDAVALAFNDLLAPIRVIYLESKEWQHVDRAAYPDP